MSSVISVKQFSKQYKKHLVKLADLTITRRVNLLVGENGSGKSTLLKAIAKLINYDGEIICNKKLCFMSETTTYPLDLELEIFLSYLNNISDSPLNNKELDSLLKSFNLFEKRKELINGLSKGMKAKVNIIQCLMEKAEIYLLDEPLSGLDKAGIKQLLKYIENSNDYFLISTHLPSDFDKLKNEIYYL